MHSMKLAVCITLFDGTELLEKCVENYRKFADYIVICYQTVSNTGLTSDNILDVVAPYRSTDTVVFYQTDLSLSIKDNERAKHTLMVNEAKKLGATHFIISAVDHFYDIEQVDRVKDIAANYDTTFTEIETYYKEPTWQVTPRVPWRMPFICKLYPDTEVKLVPNYPLFVDPACKISTYKKWVLFSPEDIVLHNYSNVRIDFEFKMKNAQLPMLWTKKKKQQIVEQFRRYDPSSKEPILYYNYAPEGVTIKEVPNYFNL